LKRLRASLRRRRRCGSKTGISRCSPQFLEKVFPAAVMLDFLGTFLIFYQMLAGNPAVIVIAHPLHDASKVFEAGVCGFRRGSR
jgi:hypothetical protein